MELPLVSIIIPTLNRANLIGETLDSIAAQTYCNWECFVVDDGSEDDTEELVKTVADSDKRVRFVRRERNPAGGSTCRNIGLSMANGKYIIFLDSDDLLAPTCLDRRVEIMEQSPEMDFAVFLTRVFHDVPGDSPFFWSSFGDGDEFERFLRFEPPWCTFGPIWRRISLARVGAWDERAKCWQDWEFHVRAIAQGLSYLKVDEPDAFCREPRSDSISHSSKKRKYVLNRARVLPGVLVEVATGLRKQHTLTPTRRRLLAALFFKLAFSSHLTHKKALTIWHIARKSRVVTRTEFYIVFGSIKLLGRIPWRIRITLFPEVRQIGTRTRHMRTTVSMLTGTEVGE